MAIVNQDIRKVHFQQLGPIPYQEAWDYQEKLLKANVQLKLNAGREANPADIPTKHHLLFCEHPHIYSLGKSGKREHLLIDRSTLDTYGITFVHTNRGGDITYHGPGQIVGYPIFDLEKFRTDIGWYLRSLEEVILKVLAEYGLVGGRIEGATGVWLDINTPNPRKICAMGVRCSRWITMHGFALNVNTDLSFFNHIVPCGIADKGVTSLQAELGREVDIQEVEELLRTYFAKVFGFSFL
ncbi:MAG: lipoyl(octanoyl) transferase LipB [Bacteroidota bacterium]